MLFRSATYGRTKCLIFSAKKSLLCEFETPENCSLLVQFLHLLIDDFYWIIASFFNFHFSWQQQKLSLQIKALWMSYLVRKNCFLSMHSIWPTQRRKAGKSPSPASLASMLGIHLSYAIRIFLWKFLIGNKNVSSIFLF